MEDGWDVPEALRGRMVEVAREFRRVPAVSERRLWAALRDQQMEGRRFRQQPIGPFVVDFFCAAERLILEVDGPIHGGQHARDGERQALLEALGLRVVRVSAEQVETDLPGVLAIIRRACLDA